MASLTGRSSRLARPQGSSKRLASLLTRRLWLQRKLARRLARRLDGQLGLERQADEVSRWILPMEGSPAAVELLAYLFLLRRSSAWSSQAHTAVLFSLQLPFVPLPEKGSGDT